MNALNTLRYAAEEEALKKKIDTLMAQWYEHFKAHSDKGLADCYEVSNLSDLFVADGFYPYYLQQKYKILFIGRECLGLAERNYIEILHNAIKDNISSMR